LAKRRWQPATDTAEGGTEASTGRSLEDAALGFAEDLGRLLGTAERKANEWMAQRKQVVAHLTELRNRANTLLDRLGGEALGGQARGRRGRPPASDAAATEADAPAPRVRKRSTMSAARRREVSERMRRYWAERRKAGGRGRKKGGE
jgi:hypothetical protein